jgi:hypothetical protein
LASLRAARMLAAIRSVRLRPSSTYASLSFSPFIRHRTAGESGELCGCPWVPGAPAPSAGHFPRVSHYSNRRRTITSTQSWAEL